MSTDDDIDKKLARVSDRVKARGVSQRAVLESHPEILDALTLAKEVFGPPQEWWFKDGEHEFGKYQELPGILDRGSGPLTFPVKHAKALRRKGYGDAER